MYWNKLIDGFVNVAVMFVQLSSTAITLATPVSFFLQVQPYSYTDELVNLAKNMITISLSIGMFLFAYVRDEGKINSFFRKLFNSKKSKKSK